MIVPFDVEQPPPLQVAGSKARELIRLTAEGFPVPPGFVLSAEFFDPLSDELERMPEWESILAGDGERQREGADALKRRCRRLALDGGRRRALADALLALDGARQGALYAVRSSSPEEDLEGASFAGVYETTLAVPADGLEAAILDCFASCVDERVLSYRRRMGFSNPRPRIALIVQTLVDADAAGVAFSLNPANNCYDEAVIEANYGLGESVVSGEASPDRFVVDKVSHNVIDERIGSKEHRLVPAEGGGLERLPLAGRNEACLSGNDVEAILDMLLDVEARRGEPVDIEWALSGGKLYLLQARPITAYFPLPRIMVTDPGTPKRLYANAGLLEQGLQGPISVLGTDFLGLVLENVGGPMAEGAIGHDALAFTAEGGYFMNVSYAAMIGLKSSSLVPGSIGDPRLKEILDGIDMGQYMGCELPPRMKALRRRMLLTVIPMAKAALEAYLQPDRVLRAYVAALPEEDRRLETFSGAGMPLRSQAESLVGLLRFFYGDYGIPMILAALVAERRLKALFKREGERFQDHLINLGIALPGNKTTEMGEEMQFLASSPEFRRFEDPADFLQALTAGALDPEFSARWRRFVEEFGMRCPGEIDTAKARPSERPEQLVEGLKELSLAEAGSPSFLDAARAKRERAYRALLDNAERRSAGRARALSRHYKAWLAFGGYRETPKHYVVKVVAIFRRQALAIARDLVAAGRLDSPEMIFDLTMDDIDRGVADPALDLRALARERSVIVRKMKRCSLAARVFDSRGRIYFPPRKAAGMGELCGVPISPGLVRGRVKVLASADDKPLLPGEILVTRAADPGWTPLFINAAGVILEVGGALQHGAVVAREFGIPCVSGVDDATAILKDGQTVELDGSSGRVRVVDPDTPAD